MDALNTLRAVLVGATVVVTLLLAADGRWLPAVVLFAGILAHVGLSVHLWREKRRAREHAAALDPAAPPG